MTIDIVNELERMLSVFLNTAIPIQFPQDGLTQSVGMKVTLGHLQEVAARIVAKRAEKEVLEDLETFGGQMTFANILYDAEGKPILIIGYLVPFVGVDIMASIQTPGHRIVSDVWDDEDIDLH